MSTAFKAGMISVFLLMMVVVEAQELEKKNREAMRGG